MPETTKNKNYKLQWRKLLQGKWLIRHVPFLIFLAVLAVVYIGNGHYADNTVRKTEKAERELRQLQYQYKAVQAEVVYRSRHAELARSVQPMGLMPSVEPPFKLKLNDSLQQKP